MTKQCKTCKFSEPFLDSKMECRFNPPQQPAGKMPNGFPLVTVSTWCGKWECKDE